MTIARITARFDQAKAEDRAAFVPYMMCGDPDLENSYACMKALAENGADVIELGAPFTDPMADGPAVQRAGQRSLKAGTTLKDVLAMSKRFREEDDKTAIIVMGYANPMHKMGWAAFADAAAEAGVDGVICVDLPPEEDFEFRTALANKDIALIRFATPTTTDERMAKIADGASGYIYYVSVAGVTGAGTGSLEEIEAGVNRARKASGLPVAVGFGVKTPEQAAAFSRIADGVVVGSAIVEHAREASEADDPASAAKRMSALVKSLSQAIAESRT